MTRRVEQVDAEAVVVELKHRRTDGDAALLFEFHPIGCGGALVFARGDGAGELDCAAVQQELFRQRGLARVGMRDNGEGASPLDFFFDAHRARKVSEKSLPTRRENGGESYCRTINLTDDMGSIR